MARVANCPCGHTLTAKDDDGLLSWPSNTPRNTTRTQLAARTRSGSS